MKIRAWSLFGALAVFFVVLSVYMYSLVTGEYSQVAAGQSTYGVTVANLRGTIYDTNMKPLVNAEKVYRAAITPDETLLPILRPAMHADDYRKLLGSLVDRKPAVVSLSKPVAFMTGLKQFLVPDRYGERLLAPHIIGYLDSAGMEGVTGLEAAYNDILQQYSGSIRASFTVDGSGNCLRGVEATITDTTNKVKGGLVLTIDKDIQQLVEDTASQYLEKGAVMVMDPLDGAVLAMASFPSYQPSTVVDSLANNDGALVNRALGMYDCGSVFKIITAAAALESGIPPQQRFTCNGALDVGGTVFHCHDRLGHQELTMDSAMASSCNLYFIQLAQHIGPSAVYDMAEKFGLTASVSLAENIGATACVMPSLSELWQSPAALANFSFGQGKLLVSPLHISRITATIANGGVLPSPYIVKGSVTEQDIVTMAENGRGERILAGTTAQSIQHMLEKVVSEGTGQQAKPANGTAAGKTGTAETGQINKGNPVVQSWFTGYVPAEDPRYIVTVLAEDAQNTKAYAPVLFCEISNNLIE